MANRPFDVIVVGSGPGGGIATYALAKAGLKVALVEAGPQLRAGEDYNAHGSPYQNRETCLKAGLHRPFRSVWERAERDHFTAVGDRPGHGLLRALGGRSLCWAGHSLRFGPLDFQRWPISYDEVAPYYSKAERLMAVYGARDGLSNMPDGDFQKPVAMRCGELMLKRGAERLKQQGRRMELIGLRKAMPTEVRPGQRAKCHYCGHCMQGCEVDSKYTSANTPIPRALETGNLTLFTGVMMTRIVMDPTGRRVAGIECVNRQGVSDRLQARVLVLSCSAIETARHLLVNKTREFPSGLANSSGHVGKNLTSHFGLTGTGYFPQIRDRDASNDDGTDYYHALLTGLYWDKPNPNFDGTYQVQCGSGVHPIGMAIRWAPAYGSSLKRELKDKNVCHASMNMQGALLVSAKKFTDLDPERHDRWGLPLPRVHLHYEQNDVAMAQDMVNTCEEIVRIAGGEVLSTPGTVTVEKLQIDYNHWVGTARMGRDPQTSVVNTDGQTHDITNLFIADASVFAAYPEKNPTLTNVALSWRTSDRLIEKLRSGELG
jgi:choline dehydrogenase-like flavoprotein